MAQNSYELVFYGQLAQGTSVQQAKENVAQLFKANAEQVERMFTGQRVVIRNKLDTETAQKYIAAMKKRGAICQLELTGQPGVKVDIEKEATVPGNEVLTNNAPGPDNQESSLPAAPPEPRETFQAKSESVNAGGLKVAGDKVDTILAQTHFELDPAGIRLSDEHETPSREFSGLDELSIAPVGSDLADKKEQVPVVEPDISHLKTLDNS